MRIARADAIPKSSITIVQLLLANVKHKVAFSGVILRDQTNANPLVEIGKGRVDGFRDDHLEIGVVTSTARHTR